MSWWYDYNPKTSEAARQPTSKLITFIIKIFIFIFFFMFFLLLSHFENTGQQADNSLDKISFLIKSDIWINEFYYFFIFGHNVTVDEVQNLWPFSLHPLEQLSSKIIERRAHSQQALKPRSYTSFKLRPTHSLLTDRGKVWSH